MPPSLVLLTDAAGWVIHANEPAHALLGACEGKRCCDLFNTRCAGGDEAYRDVGAVQVNGVLGQASRSALGDHYALVMQPRAVHAAEMERLSARERDVLRLVARGLTDVALAERLGIGAATARSYMQGVRRKLGVRSRSQAVALAIAAGLL
ncbi:MAG: helix-turn-helix transcriptional regulator [Pseudomonadota bacterium]|nr:helix-turn-helix transcriptional regulator [Pseudomonadota bacterium]